LAPNESSSYLNRGVIYEKKGNYKQAIFDYTKAIELKSDFDKAYFNRGMLYLKLGEKEKAKSDLKKVLEVSKDSDLKASAEEILRKL
jgi:tetratricopeptide (TPR) repeat protein